MAGGTRPGDFAARRRASSRRSWSWSRRRRGASTGGAPDLRPDVATRPGSAGATSTWTTTSGSSARSAICYCSPMIRRRVTFVALHGRGLRPRRRGAGVARGLPRRRQGAGPGPARARGHPARVRGQPAAAARPQRRSPTGPTSSSRYYPYLRLAEAYLAGARPGRRALRAPALGDMGARARGGAAAAGGAGRGAGGAAGPAARRRPRRRAAAADGRRRAGDHQPAPVGGRARSRVPRARSPRPPPVDRPPRARRGPRRRAAVTPRRAADARAARRGRGAGAGPAAPLEIVSQPPGASVYLDDELIGTTDPEWGRLVRSGMPPGRHRLRLALPGHQRRWSRTSSSPPGSCATSAAG